MLRSTTLARKISSYQRLRHDDAKEVYIDDPAGQTQSAEFRSDLAKYCEQDRAVGVDEEDACAQSVDEHGVKIFDKPSNNIRFFFH